LKASTNQRIAAEGEAPISDEAFEDLLFIVRNAFTRVAES